MSWNPLFRSLLTSSVLHEGPLVVAVWALIIASTDPYGESDVTIPFIATILNTPVADVERAFEILASPDKHSRTAENDGRRIIRTDHGTWYLPAHHKHREMASKESAAMRAQRYRARKSAKERSGAMPGCSVSGCKNAAATYDLQGHPFCSPHAMYVGGE